MGQDGGGRRGWYVNAPACPHRICTTTTRAAEPSGANLKRLCRIAFADICSQSTSSSSQRSDSEKDKLPPSESKGEVKDERKHSHHDSKDSEEKRKGHSRSMSSGNSSMLHTINPLRASTAQMDKKDEKKDHKK